MKQSIEVLNDLIYLLENKLGFKVELNSSDLNEESIGELSQKHIKLNSSLRKPQEIVFTLSHLFGHFIQLQEFDKYRYLVDTVKLDKPLNLPSNFKKEFWDYEKEAFQIGKKLLEQIITFDSDIERKYQIFFETDFDLFWEYLETGQEIDPMHFNKVLYQRYKSDTNTSRTPLKALDYKLLENTGHIHVKID